MYVREYDASIEFLERAVEMGPQFSGSYMWLAIVRVLRGEYEQAAAAYAQWSEVMGIDGTWVDSWAAGVREYATTGRPDLRFDIDNWSVNSSLISYAYAAVGNRDKTLSWLERTYQERRSLPDAGVNPLFDFLQDDPEYVALLERMGLND